MVSKFHIFVQANVYEMSSNIINDDERDKIVFHNTTPELQDQDQDCSVQD